MENKGYLSSVVQYFYYVSSWVLAVLCRGQKKDLSCCGESKQRPALAGTLRAAGWTKGFIENTQKLE